MKKYQLKRTGDSEPIGTFLSKQEAENEMRKIIDSNNDDLEKEDEVLTPFDFALEEVDVKDVAEGIPDYEAAKHYIGLNTKEITCIEDNLKIQKALVAFEKLAIIAEAWNKADYFVPDYRNRNQRKYFPWFVYRDDAAGFVCAGTHRTATIAAAAVGSRLCFRTEERACQFGTQFIDLWNDLLLVR